MPLDPQAQALIEANKAAGIRPNHQLSVQEARAAMLARVALTAGAPEPVGRVEDRAIPSPAGAVPVRLYWPAGDGPFPVLVYFHGGGWVCGTLDTHEAICRALTNGAGCLTISVGYRLAPEHKFPAAVEDAYAAACWAAANAAEVGGDPRRLAVGGDSAGGNLAAAVALMARDRGDPKLAYQLLIYPVTSYQFDLPSHRENAEGYLLSTADMRWYWQHYLATDEDGRSPYASPLQAPDLSGLPPALVVTAQYDPLRDEGEAYASRLRQAGVPLTYACYEGMIHGFFGRAAVLDQGKRGLQQASQSLRTAFAT